MVHIYNPSTQEAEEELCGLTTCSARLIPSQQGMHKTLPQKMQIYTHTQQQPKHKKAQNIPKERIPRMMHSRL